MIKKDKDTEGTSSLCIKLLWWLVERTDSIWYPSLTLYRQPTLDDWDSVYASIRKRFTKRLTVI